MDANFFSNSIIVAESYLCHNKTYEMFKDKLAQLIIEFRTLQNGIVVEAMERRGICYHQNFGLSVRQIKKVAEAYSPDQDFAEFLFDEEIREAKISAFLIAEPEKITPEKTKHWIARFTNPELVEQGCSLLLQHVDVSPEEVLRFCQSDKEMEKMTGYWLVARLSMMGMRFNENENKTFFELVFSDSMSNSASLRLAISRALVSLGKTHEQNLAKVRHVCRRCAESENLGAAWISEEVGMMLDA